MLRSLELLYIDINDGEDGKNAEDSIARRSPALSARIGTGPFEWIKSERQSVELMQVVTHMPSHEELKKRRPA